MPFFSLARPHPALHTPCSSVSSEERRSSIALPIKSSRLKRRRRRRRRRGPLTRRSLKSGRAKARRSLDFGRASRGGGPGADSPLDWVPWGSSIRASGGEGMGPGGGGDGVCMAGEARIDEGSSAGGGVRWSGVERSGVEWSGVEWSGVERIGVKSESSRVESSRAKQSGPTIQHEWMREMTNVAGTHVAAADSRWARRGSAETGRAAAIDRHLHHTSRSAQGDGNGASERASAGSLLGRAVCEIRSRFEVCDGDGTAAGNAIGEGRGAERPVYIESPARPRVPLGSLVLGASKRVGPRCRRCFADLLVFGGQGIEGKTGMETTE
ncbi:hypothetical protein JHW43_001303 [Diplocarpon mali]|nr:hypothetical protein JHW43_001303 [Diplocarpon mali]